MERKRTKLAQAAPAEVPTTQSTADPTEVSTTNKVSHCPDIGEKKVQSNFYLSHGVAYVHNLFNAC